MEKRQSQTILSTIVIAVAALGMLGGYAISNVSFESQINTMQNNAFMTGHVALTLKDSDGNIKEYRQTDNLIVTTGENCASKLLFTASGSAQQSITGTTGLNSTVACSGAITSPFTVIAIGNNTANSDANTGDYCEGQIQSTGVPQEVGGGNIELGCEHTNISGFDRAEDGVPVFTNATQSTATKTAAKVVIDKTFTNNQGSAQTVSESGVFNNTAAGNATSAMFARQTFSTITVSNGDSLTVEWTINVGSADALDDGAP